MIVRQEIVLFIMGGVFVAETLSVMIQVLYFKWTGGKRIFRMAPLHHHFELIGWAEEKVTIRFWLSRSLIRGYIEIWRGLPIIVTLFIVFFVFPIAGHRFEFDPFTAGTIALTLWGSAQVAEATRGAVESIPREQHEAASALGVSDDRGFVVVVLLRLHAHGS